MSCDVQCVTNTFVQKSRGQEVNRCPQRHHLCSKDAGKPQWRMWDGQGSTPKAPWENEGAQCFWCKIRSFVVSLFCQVSAGPFLGTEPRSAPRSWVLSPAKQWFVCANISRDTDKKLFEIDRQERLPGKINFLCF